MDWARLLLVAPVPLLGLAGAALVGVGLTLKAHVAPFIGALLIFLSGYIGLAVGFAPYVVPYALTFRQAATAPNSMALLLTGFGDPAAADPGLLGLCLLAVPRKGDGRCRLPLRRAAARFAASPGSSGSPSPAPWRPPSSPTA